MGKALYRKYRSKKLSEIIGQEHITRTLSNALKKQNISHAYLFTGPRGVGKTSIARILAHEVNRLPYQEDSNHLDIIEIDAASNRRIDEIRELRERVHTTPTNAKYKVYIIDEVHMLTKEAFNALLKTLEEPPDHAIFILATTEAHKLPDTIISRTQRFNFKPVDKKQAVEHLRYIASQENITISDEALGLIADHAGGSFRDSISLLDQASGIGKKIELDQVQAILGIAPNQAINNLINVFENNSSRELLVLLREFKEHGYSPAQIAKQLGIEIRKRLVEGGTGLNTVDITKFLNDLLQVPASHDPETALEITLLGITLKPQAQSSKPSPEPVKQVAQKPITTPPEKIQTAPSPEPINTTPNQNDKKPPAGKLNLESWQQTLEIIRKKHNTLYGIARMASVEFSENEITLCFQFPFHQKRVNEARNKQILAEVIHDLTGVEVIINCTVDKNKKAPANIPKPQEPSIALDTISNIFGSAEVLE